MKKKIGENSLIKILDTTLREGEQTPGVYFNPHIKLAIADMLDQVGVDFIEAGHPLVSGNIYNAVRNISQRNLKATVGAHSRSLKKDVDLALECGVGFLGIFYCVSDNRLDNIFKTDLDSAISQITEIIKYAKEKKPNLLIRFTPEDTVRSEFHNVVKAAVAAVKAGADVISVADTTGHMIPGTDRNMFDYITNLRREFSDRNLNPMIAVHLHNDRGFALANALDSYRAGVDIIDATVLGLGERAGLVDLAGLLTIIKTDFNEGNWNLAVLPQLYELISKHSGIPIPVNYPIIGENAFTHCAGVHIQAAVKDPLHYQSLDPAIIGRESKMCLDHMSGIASVKHGLSQIGEDDVGQEIALRILDKVKEVGETGRIVELDELRQILEWCREHAIHNS
jgi:2-isopropylmalate synthase